MDLIATDLTDPAPALTDPDFTQCDAKYGRDLVRLECLQAANRLPHGLIAWPHALLPTPGFNAPFRLPISLNMGKLVEEQPRLQSFQAYLNVFRWLLHLR